MRARLGLLVIGGVAAALATRQVAHAQRARREAWAEAGYTRVRQRGFAGSDAGSLAARWACTLDGGELAASGALLAAPDGGAIGSGALEGWGRLWRHDALRFDVGASASLIASTDMPSAAFGGVASRGAFDAGPFAAWLGASAGALRHDAPVQPSVGFDAGAVRRLASGGAGDVRVGAVASATWVRREDLAPLNSGRVGTDRYSELSGFGEWRAGAGTLALTGGVRVGEAGARERQGFVVADAEWRLTSVLALVAGGGSQLGDPTRGAAAAHFASIGVRVSAWRPSSRSESRRESRHDVAGAARVLVMRAAGPGSRIVVRAAGAQRVEAMGDFSDWAPVALVARDGDWELLANVASGSHRILVRVDGGAWRVPLNLPSVDDDLGGRVGLLVVPD